MPTPTAGGGAALAVASYGGTGGQGGKGSAAGAAGVGAAAGDATAYLYGEVYTSGYDHTYGVLVQSLGGAGGNGGHSADWFNPVSGAGNTGGAAANATVVAQGALVMGGRASVGNQGDNNVAVTAQSIGGGGGIGPNSNGWFAVGGNGGNGSDGAAASVSMQSSTVETWGFGSTGILAQSIGGGGGKGGDATGHGTITTMTIGGTAGGGGNADDASARIDGGSVTTAGDHAAGLVMQSIGGGGGAGGSSYGFNASLLYGAALSVGGTGGAGGNGGTVNSAKADNNTGTIVTSGAESFGLLGQSIGGGGGTGGASTAKSMVLAPKDTASFSLSLSTGGDGKSGGNGGQVYLQSSGLIATKGAGAIGIIGQSVGGGGGSGGDASASSSTKNGAYSLSASVAHGGQGEGGGNGGDSTAINKGLIFTSGESADGMLVQSIGGGGGNGGAGDAKSSAGADKSLVMSLGMGGDAGKGGQSGNVYATNDGSIATLGDGAHGMVAQSVAGGGGRGGGAAVSTDGNISLGVALGGQGGDGGDSWTLGSQSTVTNTGSIVTFGADSHAILAQSIGGGGGAGGKAGTSIGSGKSNDDGSNGSDQTLSTVIQKLTEAFQGSDAMDPYDTVSDLLALVNQSLGNVVTGLAADDVADAADSTAESGGKTEDDNEAKSLHLSLGIGGTGGLGGAGGNITVTNSGDVATMGKHSDAIVVQSIGGGGGKGGAASTASSGDYSGGIAIGGSDGKDAKGKSENAENGGQVFVTNSGQVVTVGALSNAIVAQSIAGGGGIGGTSTATSEGEDGKKSYALNIAVGGNATGLWGGSEAVKVTNTGAIETRGHDSYGIIAQSVSGGGGLVKTLATDLDNAGGSATASSAKDFAANIQLGSGKQNVSKDSGAVIVSTSGSGTIITSGDNSIGILAQSVSAGGGLAQGGTPVGTTADQFIGTTTARIGHVGAGLSTDPSANTGITVDVGANVWTKGIGSFGVFAQSVGGGGGIAGNLGQTMDKQRMGKSSTPSIGNGGDIKVGVENGVWITTQGTNAAALVAQSVGGGGGWFTNETAAFIGSAGGKGNGGAITVDVLGAVDAQGPASVGILAQSTGGADNGGTGTGGQITINVGRSGDGCDTTNQWTCAQVYGGNGWHDDAAAIYIADGSQDTTKPNTLTNYGYIATHDTTDGTAIFSDGATFQGDNYGLIAGNVHLSAGTLVNHAGGTITPYQSIRMGEGTLDNQGTLDLTHKAQITTLEGNYEGRAGSLIVHGADFAAGTADVLHITGDARFDGGFAIRPTTLRKGTVEIARVEGALTLDGNVQSVGDAFFTYGIVASEGSITVTPEAQIAGSSGATGNNRRAVAGHLQEIWDSGVQMDRGFAALAGVDAEQAAATLDMLSGQALGLIGASRYQASQQFIDGIWSGCDLASEERCSWGKWTGSRADMETSQNAAGYETRAWGFHIGGVQAVSTDLTIGGAIGYENMSASDRDNIGSIDGDAVQLGGFARWTRGDWQLSGAVELGYGWFDTTRQVALGGLGGQATGSTNSWQAGLHGRAAWHRETSWGFVQPQLDVSLLHIRTDGFAEQGASPFNLAVAGASGTTLIVTPGVTIGRDVALSNGSVLKLSGSLGYALMSDQAWSPTATLVEGTSGFSAQTDLPDRLLKVGFEAELMTKGNAIFSAAYRGEIGSGYDSHTAELRVGYRF